MRARARVCVLFLNLQTTSNTHGASPRRGLLCNEYPWDSKEKKGNRLRSPFRLCDAAFIGIKKLNKYVFFGCLFFFFFCCKTVLVSSVLSSSSSGEVVVVVVVAKFSSG